MVGGDCGGVRVPLLGVETVTNRLAAPTPEELYADTEYVCEPDATLTS